MSQMTKVGKYKTKIIKDNDNIIIKYFNTNVVTIGKAQIMLDNGGYCTVSTKTRMNQASNQFGLGYRVWQKDYNWYVDYKGETIPYIDKTMILLK
jgi:hypothetical protein